MTTFKYKNGYIHDNFTAGRIWTWEIVGMTTRSIGPVVFERVRVVKKKNRYRFELIIINEEQ